MTLLSLNPEYADKIDQNRFEFCNALVAALKGEDQAAALAEFGAELVPEPITASFQALSRAEAESILRKLGVGAAPIIAENNAIVAKNLNKIKAEKAE